MEESKLSSNKKVVENYKISQIRAVSDRLGLFLQLGWDWPEAD
ncbi:hypothetical protein WD019_06915 [Fictibacillus sp. Mic-4]